MKDLILLGFYSPFYDSIKNTDFQNDIKFYRTHICIKPFIGMHIFMIVFIKNIVNPKEVSLTLFSLLCSAFPDR